MQKFKALSNLPQSKNLKKGDVLVVFGELFQRGYANGLVEAAEKLGIKIVYSTVGRRDKDGSLRALSADELAQAPQPLINIPLEAGFDMEADNQGQSPAGRLREVKLQDWKSTQISDESIEQSQQKGASRFRKNVQAYLKELEQHIPDGANVIFAHLMAGGVPRTKVVLPLLNRVLRGTGDKFISSEEFWTSSLGRLCSRSFDEVTANTFDQLIDLSTDLRKKIESKKGRVSYLAYGYHGTEILIQEKYQWQTYTPYLQAWAKMKLEGYASKWKKQGVQATVYNCPEILTNSSSIFSGVELSLYPLILSLAQGSSVSAQNTLQHCMSLFKPDVTLKTLQERLDQYHNHALIRQFCVFDKWPQHNSQEQMEFMLKSSDELIALHQNPKELTCFKLSELVFEACGSLMIQDCFEQSSAAVWLGHDIIARWLDAKR